MMYKRENVLAGIVTYNPDIERLNNCISAVKDQVDTVLIVDNGSKNCSEIRSLISSEFEFIEWKENKGIAAALKSIMNFAISHGYYWVLSIDQDSIIQKGLVDEYLKYANRTEFGNVGIFTCLRRDRNFLDRKHEIQREESKTVDSCITSAAFCNVKKYCELEGYDESFFIDCVDFDICYQFRDAGYDICRINYQGLLHEVGRGENRKFLFWTIVVYHHNEKRIYTLSRNMVFLWKKHRNIYGIVRLIKKQSALLVRILFYESGKKNKIDAFVKGTKEGLRSRKYC